MLNTARNIQRRRIDGDESGFTLIELLIVIIVLGILAAIVVFALGGVTGQSAVAACNSDAKTVSVAVSAYEAQNNGAIPASVAALESSSNGGPFLKSVPATTYYTIGIDGNGNVTVALVAGDAALPTGGTAWTGDNAGGTVGSVVAGTGYNYEGTSAFTFATPAADATKGICQGA